MSYQDTRIYKLREYLISIINQITNNENYQINANMLDNNADNYSIDKIPTSSIVEKWIIGYEMHKDVYNFRSRKAYSQDTINNLKNIGFFEQFEGIIKSNNEKGILPDIEGIEEIKCLNCGTLNNAGTNTAEFDIQIQVTYKEDNEEKIISL